MPTQTTSTKLRAGDIISYAYESPFRRDGFAEVHEDWRTGEVYAKDTFDTNDTQLTGAELATGRLLFNLEDFEERRWLNAEDYDPADVFVLDTRKGMVQRKFLRNGAETLPEWLFVSRRLALRDAEQLQARAELLSPLIDQAYAATPLPTLTIEESGELIDTVRWVQRASRDFLAQLDHLIGILGGTEGNLHFQTVLTDEDHHELVRARRALDSKLEALRSA